MLFSNLLFLFLFLPTVVIAYFMFLNKLSHRNILLLISSILFYAWGEPVYVIIMLVSIVINYKIALLIEDLDDKEEVNRKILLIIAIVANISIFFVFKYEIFLVDILTNILPVRYTSARLPLPIGISFFTFQATSYVIDVYRRNAKAQRKITDLGLYISFFPQLIAGPIVRYNTVAEQINDRVVTIQHLSIGVKRFIIGLAKKIILSNQFAIIAEASFSHELPSFSFAWLGAISYTLQIYFDFSGYSDMAIGLGKLFGFDFMENFNYPYISGTVSEFWRRWHISLGGWFRDYLYIPLGGSRVSKSRMVLNLFIVWFCTGFWHGASWKFLVWGMIYFIALTFEKIYDVDNRIKKSFCTRVIYQIITLILIIFGWVIFAEEDLIEALLHIKIMIDIRYIDFLQPSVETIQYMNVYSTYIIVGLILSTPLIEKVVNKINVNILKSKRPTLYSYINDIGCTIIYIILFFISVSYVLMGGHNPFIYFNF